MLHMNASEESRLASTSRGWRKRNDTPSLPEVHQSMKVPLKAGFFRKLLAFAGPGYLVAVGYMDPGNWASDLAGGAMFNYSLLSVIMISNLMAILLQSLSARLGIATGRDLAQACRDHYSKPVSMGLWVLCELAIAACDLAEVIGTAIALQLLFGIPLLYGVLITSVDVILVLMLQNKGFRHIEVMVISFIAIIILCFGVELFLSQPDMAGVMGGFVPTTDIVTNPEMLYIALAMLGATVMPHNLYLHSSIVQTRKIDQSVAGKKSAIRFATIDSTVALTIALFVNAAILILAASAFYSTGHTEVAEIQDAYHLLTPLLGTGMASILFAVALLASGQNSTLTGTLAGQIVMEGFLNLRLKPWIRRLITRLIAIIPAIIVIGLYGEGYTGQLLIFSQVVLSLQLSFAVFPLVKFTSDPVKMGPFLAPQWVRVLARIVAVVIAALNIYLLYSTFF